MSIAIGVLALSLIGADLPMPRVSPPRQADPVELELWQLTLPEAIKICLDNDEITRVIRLEVVGVGGATHSCNGFGSMQIGNLLVSCADPNHIVIAQLEPAMSPWRFQAEVMAEVRATEQTYWELAQQHVQLWPTEKALELARALLKREREELQVGRGGNAADVAEIEQRLEQFTRDHATQTADMIATERRFRNLLRLPPDDNRRIIPVTSPTETLVKFDWDECVARMRRRQPDLAAQRALVERLERTMTDASQTLLEQTPTALIALGLDSSRSLQSTAAALLAEPRAALREVEHKTTHSLARFFLKVNADYKQVKTASRLRSAAAQRLEAQRAFYEEGRIPVDRYLDAMSQYTAAVAQVARLKSDYNVSIAALEEARGTLLDARKITIAQPLRRVHPYPNAADSGLQKASFTPESGQPVAPSGR